MVMMVIVIVIVLMVMKMGMITGYVAVFMVIMTMRVITMIMMMAFSKEVEMKVARVAAKPLLQHPDTNNQYYYGGKKSKPGVKFRFRIGSRQEPGNNTKKNYAECVGKGNNQAKQHAINRSSPGADHIGCNQGFTMSWFKRVQRPQSYSTEIEHQILGHVFYLVV
jgi:hypothetical protein